MTESQYRDLRRRFAGSRYDDIRDAGTRFVDLVWSLNGVGREQALGMILLMGGQIIQTYSTLSGASTAHGVTIPPLAAN